MQERLDEDEDVPPNFMPASQRCDPTQPHNAHPPPLPHPHCSCTLNHAACPHARTPTLSILPPAAHLPVRPCTICAAHPLYVPPTPHATLYADMPAGTLRKYLCPCRHHPSNSVVQGASSLAPGILPVYGTCRVAPYPLPHFWRTTTSPVPEPDDRPEPREECDGVVVCHQQHADPVLQCAQGFYGKSRTVALQNISPS